MDLAHQLIADYQPPEHVSLVLQPVDPVTCTFDLEVHPAYRGIGLGSAALADLTDLATELGVALSIRAEPDPEDGPTQAQLMRWYRRYGFARVGWHGLMFRPGPDHP